MSAGLLAALAAAAPLVLSADFCADQYALALADRSAIAALSLDAERDFSYLRADAAGLPQARAGAEEVVASGAALVLRFWGGDAAQFERLGVKVVTLDYASDFDGVAANIRKAAAALGQKARGESLIGRMNAKIAAGAASAAAPGALYVTPGGVTAGKGTMIDAILGAAGLRNLAAEKGFGWPPLPLEELAAAPPSVIVAGFFDDAGERINHWSAHGPAVTAIFESAVVIRLPADEISCPAWFAADAVVRIRSEIEPR